MPAPVSYPHAPVRPGDVLAGKYRVERILGMGGMGVVVAATHLQLQQLVALKFVLPAALESSGVERFLREARASVRLKSEHVARVTDVGTLENGAPYMVMEYLEGSDLSDLLEKTDEPLEPDEAASYVLQACEAIAEAHSLGIIHRDLKPHNLFLAMGVGGVPIVKVLDFGISKVLEGNFERALTQTTAIMGSPLYMSPEQMRSSRNVDQRTDIWALGVILFELLTKKLPFDGETLTEIALKVVQDPAPSVLVHRFDIPHGLADVVARCLEKSPDARFQDASELAAALEPFAPHDARTSGDRARLMASGLRSMQQSRPSFEPPRFSPRRTTPMGSGGAGASGASGGVSGTTGGSSGSGGLGSSPFAPPATAPAGASFSTSTGDALGLRGAQSQRPATASTSWDAAKSQPVPAPRRSRRVPMIIAAAVVLPVTIALTMWRIRTPPAPPTVSSARSAATLLEATPSPDSATPLLPFPSATTPAAPVASIGERPPGSPGASSTPVPPSASASTPSVGISGMAPRVPIRVPRAPGGKPLVASSAYPSATPSAAPGAPSSMPSARSSAPPRADNDDDIPTMR